MKALSITDIGAGKIIGGIIFSVALSFGIYFLNAYIPYVKFVFMVLLTGVFAGWITNKRMDLAITAGSISIGISYGFGIISTAIIGICSLIITGSNYDLVVTLMSVPLQFAFIMLLFKVRRLRNGMTFLQEKGAGAVGLAISGIIMIAIILITNQGISRELRLIFIICAILCVAGLIAWWRVGLTNLYRKRIRERDMRDLEEEITKLREGNEYMAAQIHRDNKLLIAMHETVTAHTGSEHIQTQIEALMKERMGAIVQSQKNYKTLPGTKDDTVDGVMKVTRQSCAIRPEDQAAPTMVRFQSLPHTP
jgi:MFS family permease